MKQQDKLRNALREYYDTQQFPVNGDEWERASAYLNAARRRRKIRYSAIVIGALVTVLFISVFQFPKATGNEKLLSGQKPKPVTASQGAIFRAPRIKQPGTELLIAGKKDNQHSTTTMISLPEKSNNIQNVPPDLSLNKTAKIVETKAVVMEQDFTGQKDAVREAPVNENASVLSPATVAVVATTDNTVEGGNKPEVQEDPKVNEEIAPVTLENTAYQQNRFQEKETSPVQVSASSQTGESIALGDNKKETARIDTIKFAAPEKAVAAVVIDTVHPALVAVTPAIMEPATGDTLPETTYLGNLAGEGLFYEAGAAWLYGWKGPAHRDARGLSPVVGIHYMNRLGRRCALSFGLQYLQVSNLSNSSKTSRVSSYIYGEQSRVTVITPSSAYYLLAPLRFHYYTNHRNSFGAGINLAYLLNVNATVTSHDEGPGFTGNYKAVKLGGYTQGFSWFDSQLAFCYRRRISSSFGLQAEIFIGLIDVKQDQFFDFSNKERNSGAKLSLVYYAFRKNGK